MVRPLDNVLLYHSLTWLEVVELLKSDTLENHLGKGHYSLHGTRQHPSNN